MFHLAGVNRPKDEKEFMEGNFGFTSMLLDLLKKHNIVLENNIGYNHVYVANMLRADMFKSSIPDEPKLALGIKDVIDDVDASQRLVFKKWLVAMDDSGEPIDWAELL